MTRILTYEVTLYPDGVTVHSDEILAPSDIMKRNKKHLMAHFEKLSMHYLAISPEKGAFGVALMTSLGHYNDIYGMLKSQLGILSIKVFPIPRTIKA
ncbi:unnamed protein product [Protopolystoma xenopodis]|uniref:Uncharacterized protein n=1 Tax=Protopolystoma xenopodis TaxID=117903 RepID=A0A448X7E0_9PLAT|nr:unnamed protein product [Protopolystoma xenopodis]